MVLCTVHTPDEPDNTWTVVRPPRCHKNTKGAYRKPIRASDVSTAARRAQHSIQKPPAVAKSPSWSLQNNDTPSMPSVLPQHSMLVTNGDYAQEQAQEPFGDFGSAHASQRNSPASTALGRQLAALEFMPQSGSSGPGDKPSRSTRQAVTRNTKARPTGILTLAEKANFTGLILQPDSPHVTEEQLTTEIRAIYAGLIMAEAKCINVDAALAADPNSKLEDSQWQALVALHRTLMYEHHDFCMATRHPSATPSLRGLPIKYAMPARMWKHAIHTFLELLRHRRPDSQDYLESFLYLAYQMIALLYETVPEFLDTWIECLGDLARYRTAIETDRPTYNSWATAAAGWYNKASDRHPQIGRLYHHLAILQPPGLHKLALYGKSMSCVIPFSNARDSLAHLCAGILKNQLHVDCSPSRAVEAALCKVSAAICLGWPDAAISENFDEAISFLNKPDTFSWRFCGVPLAIANISALFGNGSSLNFLRQTLEFTNREDTKLYHDSGEKLSECDDTAPSPTDLGCAEASRLLLWAKRLTLACWTPALRLASTGDTMAFNHTMLSFVHCLARAEANCKAVPSVYRALTSVITLSDFAWSEISELLNRVAQVYPLTLAIMQHAKQGTWPGSEDVLSAMPLPEDWSLRGMIWQFACFCPGWFNGKGDIWERMVEDDRATIARAERTIYLGLRLAFVGYVCLYVVLKANIS
ncbi:hypothetical protein BAUCODRAFT_575151 [Baudoinia panamericana UAMH 10762]|uniref:DNA/RNA-binding domain-containing protein n=1 Tax=Baudoinia panamericana (strain UAMH 10762) TaxID=717646 RepID=M2LS21_BAUPA|nr:uncharacterized protein BAUCODRAFT_575151 [Baudoinia panamericana UAMH 10762]EMC97267.1 hypothetical protein BAUCODRAFT_575151 [Baudoinia panamericana UAMH 10762]